MERFIAALLLILMAPVARGALITYPSSSTSGFAVADDISTSAQLTTDNLTPTNLADTGTSLREYLQGVDDALATAGGGAWDHDALGAGTDDACLSAPIVDGETAAEGRAIVYCTAYGGNSLTDGYFTATRSTCTTDTDCAFDHVEFWYVDRLAAAGTADAGETDVDECAALATFHAEADDILDDISTDQGVSGDMDRQLRIHLPSSRIYCLPSAPLVINDTDVTRELTWIGHGTEFRAALSPDEGAEDGVTEILHTEDNSMTVAVATNSMTASTSEDVQDGANGVDWSVGDIWCPGAPDHDTAAEDCYVITWIENSVDEDTSGTVGDVVQFDRVYEGADETVATWTLYQGKMIEVSVDYFKIEGDVRVRWDDDQAWLGLQAGIDVDIGSVDCSGAATDCARANPWGRVRIKSAQCDLRGLELYGEVTHPYDYGIGFFSNDDESSPRNANGCVAPQRIRGPALSAATAADLNTVTEDMLDGDQGTILAATNAIRFDGWQFKAYGVAFKTAAYTGWHEFDLNGAGDDLPQLLRAHGLRWMYISNPSQEQDWAVSNHPWIDITTSYVPDLVAPGAADDAASTEDGRMFMEFDRINGDTANTTDRDFMHLANNASNDWSLEIHGLVRQFDDVFTLTNDDAGISITGDIETASLGNALFTSTPSSALVCLTLNGAYYCPNSTITAGGATGTGTWDFSGADNVLNPVPATEDLNNGNSITADACGGIKRVSSAEAGDATTSTTDTFTAPAAGNKGCTMVVCNVDATDDVILDDNPNFLTAAGADITLDTNHCVRVTSSGASGAWYQDSPVNVGDSIMGSTAGVVHPASDTNDFAVGGTGTTDTLHYDESAGVLSLNLAGSTIDIAAKSTGGQCSLVKEGTAQGADSTISLCMPDAGCSTATPTYDLPCVDGAAGAPLQTDGSEGFLFATASTTTAVGHLTVEGQLDGGTVESFGATDTTPSVATGSYFATDGTAQTLTDFDDGVDGQMLLVESTDATVFDCDGVNDLDCGTTDITTASGDTTLWFNVGGGTGGVWKLISYTQQADNLGLDNTGSGSLGTNLSSSTDDILSDNGTILLGGTGGTNNGTLDFDFETTAGTCTVTGGGSTPVTAIDFGSIDLLMGNALSFEAGTADVDMTLAEGVMTIVAAGGTNDEGLAIDFDTATANEVGVDSASGKGVTDINFNALNLLTSGTIRGSVDIVTTTGTTDSPSCDELKGTFHVSNNAAGTDYTLPEISTCGAGASACFYDLNGGGVVVLDSATGDVFYLDGTALTAANAIDSAGALGDFICILAIDNTNWLTLGRSGTWVDGGAD